MAIVSAMTDGDPLLFLVRLNTGGCEVETVKTVDITRTYGYLVLRDVGVEDSLRLAGRPNLRDDLLDIGAVLIAADALGAADRALELSVEYAKVRNQFGRPIGTFQAVKHKLVNMYIGLKSAEMSVDAAVRELDHGANLQSRRSIAEAAMLARDSACQITGEAIQAHGGIGYTWEHDCHLLLKRAHLDAALFGSTSYFAERVVREYPEYEAREEATGVG
jgi:alkylation response protein AidB-like acyl-CoA dehydrogenase